MMARSACSNQRSDRLKRTACPHPINSLATRGRSIDVRGARRNPRPYRDHSSGEQGVLCSRARGPQARLAMAPVFLSEGRKIGKTSRMCVKPDTQTALPIEQIPL
jgi:hypothetical protein